MTKAGIEYDLEKTPYSIEMIYGFRRFRYFFSSENAMNRFKERVEVNREYLNNSLSNRFKMNFILSPEFCDVQLYRKEERRGFRILIERWLVKWPAQLYFDGMKIQINSLGEN